MPTIQSCDMAGAEEKGTSPCELEPLMEEQVAGLRFRRGPRMAVATAALLFVGFAATAASQWPAAAPPQVGNRWPAFWRPHHSDPRKGWAPWTRPEELIALSASHAASAEEAEEAEVAVAEIARDSTYTQEASTIEAESKPPSESCRHTMRKTEDLCSKQGHNAPDMEKLCEEGSKCNGLLQDVKDACPPEVDMKIDEVMEACAVMPPEGEHETKTEKAEEAELEAGAEDGLEEGLEEATHGPSKACRAAVEDLPGVCGLKAAKPDMAKLCEKGPCEDAMKTVEESCEPVFASQVLAFKGMCDPCGTALASMPQECQSMRGLPRGTCKGYMCSLDEACKDAEEIMGMSGPQVQMFKESIGQMTSLLDCSSDPSTTGAASSDPSTTAAASGDSSTTAAASSD